MPQKDTIDEHMERVILPLNEYVFAIASVVKGISVNSAKMSVIEYVGCVKPRGFRHLDIVPDAEAVRGVVKTTWRVERMRSIERKEKMSSVRFGDFFPALV